MADRAPDRFSQRGPESLVLGQGRVLLNPCWSLFVVLRKQG